MADQLLKIQQRETLVEAEPTQTPEPFETEAPETENAPIGALTEEEREEERKEERKEEREDVPISEADQEVFLKELNEEQTNIQQEQERAQKELEKAQEETSAASGEEVLIEKASVQLEIDEKGNVVIPKE